MSRCVHIRAPCRLHFGMFSFGHADRPQFGGVGAMVDRPAVEVTIRPAERFSARGDHAARAERFARAAARHWRLGEMTSCEIEVASPPDHVGLGVGTQLGLAVAAGLRRFLDMPEASIEELAESVGRGARSAVGTYGFQQGGLIVDAGKGGGRPLGKLEHRAALPDDWRIVLVRPAGGKGLAGEYEADAFARLPAVPEAVTRELWRITEAEMLPAIERVDCRAFGDAVYRLGRRAGECFAAVQGGPFASPEIARLVTAIRDRGVPGVGQSSWGPTVFAFTADEEEAVAISNWLHQTLDIPNDRITIARPNHCGAQVSTAS